MAITTQISVGNNWTLIPGSASTVTISPGNLHIGGIRIAYTDSTVTPPSGVIGHLLTDTGALYQRGAGEAIWAKGDYQGCNVCYTEGA